MAPKKCSVLFEYHTTSSIFQFSDIEKDAKQVVKFVPFNRHEIWAKNVFVHHKSVDLIDCDETKLNNLSQIDYKPLDGIDGISPEEKAHVHLVIVGMSKMGIALAVQALHQAHYPNIVKYPDQRTRITFIDTNADKEMAFFQGRYATLFELIRHRYIDTVGNDTYEEKWIDPLQEDKKWQHLSDVEDINKKNFLDVEVEFIKGSVESDNIRSILCEISKDQTAKLTIAICLTQTHQAIAASLYMPIEVYENKRLQQILVYQREASDIVTNLEKNKHHIRYMNLRPFGMLYGEYINERAYFYKSMLVNWAYSVQYEKQMWPQGFNEKSDITKQIKKQWDSLKVCDQYSNMFFVDTIYQKVRCVLKEQKLTLSMEYRGKMYEMDNVQSILKSAIDKYKSALAICEHNRWNVQQLLLGFTPADAKQDRELRGYVVNGMIPKERDAKFKTKKNNLKSDVRRIHPNICDYKHLALVDPKAPPYDEKLNDTDDLCVKAAADPRNEEDEEGFCSHEFFSLDYTLSLFIIIKCIYSFFNLFVYFNTYTFKIFVNIIIRESDNSDRYLNIYQNTSTTNYNYVYNAAAKGGGNYANLCSNKNLSGTYELTFNNAGLII